MFIKTIPFSEHVIFPLPWSNTPYLEHNVLLGSVSILPFEQTDEMKESKRTQSDIYNIVEEILQQ